MWNLIYNNLKIFIDPFIFMGLKNLEERVLLVGMLHNYSTKIDPNLCEITFFYPKYIEENFKIGRTFLPSDKITFIEQAPEISLNLFPIDQKIKKSHLLIQIK